MTTMNSNIRQPSQSKLRRVVVLACIGGALALGAVASAASRPEVSFSGAKTYAVDGVSSIALGDVNGDGSPDVATASYAGGNVSVLLNKGDGSFEAKRVYATGLAPVSIALGDLNGDGKADVVTANLWDDTISVLLAKADGTLEAKQDYETAFGPMNVAIGDLDGDGKPDLAVADDQADTASVLRNRGDGSFEARQDYETGAGPDAVAIGDVNGDGRPDLVTANGAAGDVSVLLNRGGGTFDRIDGPEIAGGFPSLAVGDVNGDGRPDLAVASGGEPLSLLFNRGDGRFGSRRDHRVYPDTVAIGDLNGDGRLDLVADGFLGPAALLNRGGGSFGERIEYPESGSVALGDLNEDGKLDMATTDVYAGKVSIRLNAPGLCNVQQAVDLTLAGAKKALARGGCRVGKIRRVNSAWVKEGVVISQRPKFGAVLPEGGNVKLVVSKGKRK
jgi:hypothetical protein